MEHESVPLMFTMPASIMHNQTRSQLLQNSTEPIQYTWRHGRVLLIIAEFIKHHRADASVYYDLHSFRATDNPPSTIPPEILPTSARPDICHRPSWLHQHGGTSCSLEQ